MSGGGGFPEVAAQWAVQPQAGAALQEDWLRQQQQHAGLAPPVVPGAGSGAAGLLRGGAYGAAPNAFQQQVQQVQQQVQQGQVQHPPVRQPSAASDPAAAAQDAAAMQEAQRAVLLRLRQQIAAAAAAKQQLAQQAQQAQQQAQQGGAAAPASGPASEAPQQAQQGQQQGLQQQRSVAQSTALNLIAQLSGRLEALRQGQDGPPPAPLIEVDSDLLEKEGERVVSALSGGRAQRAWALNVLLVLSYRQELRLGGTKGLLAALLPVLQEGLTAAVGLNSTASPALPSEDDIREQVGLPPLPGWQARRAQRLGAQLFPDCNRVVEQLEEAAAAAVVLRNAAEVQQNSALLLDPPVMRCWTWCLNAARELVLQRDKGPPGTSGGGSGAAAASPPAAAAAGDAATAAAGPDAVAVEHEGGAAAGGAGASQPAPAQPAGSAEEQWESVDGEGLCIDVGGGPAADICTSLLQMTTVLSSHMLLPAFFECGMLLLRSMLILLRPTWQQCCPATRSYVLPPPLVTLATLAVAAVATAYQPNTDILLSMTGAAGGGHPGATLMQVIADMMICPFQVFRLEAEKAADEGCPGWRALLPSDAQLLRESRHPRDKPDLEAAALCQLAAQRCTLDMLAVLSQLRYLSAQLHLLWRLLTAAEPAGAHARAAAAACPHLLGTLCEIAVHRWPQHPPRWHADNTRLHEPSGYPAYLRFLSHDMMPAMRERQELLQPLRADAAALLALLSADPATRHSVAFCERQIVSGVMSGIVPPSEPGVSALLARFAAAAQHSAGGGGGGAGGGAPTAMAMPAAGPGMSAGGGAPMAMAMPAAGPGMSAGGPLAGVPFPMAAAGQMAGVQPNGRP